MTRMYMVEITGHVPPFKWEVKLNSTIPDLPKGSDGALRYPRGEADTVAEAYRAGVEAAQECEHWRQWKGAIVRLPALEVEGEAHSPAADLLAHCDDAPPAWLTGDEAPAPVEREPLDGRGEN